WRRGDRAERIAEVGDALREVDVQPVGDVRGRRLEDDLVVAARAQLVDDVVVGIRAGGDAALYAGSRRLLEQRQRRREQMLALAALPAVAVEGEMVGIRHEHDEGRRACGD